MNNFFFTLTKFFILLSLTGILILVYKSEIVHSGSIRENYFSLFIFFLMIMILSLINFFLKKKNQFKINLLLVSIIFSVYLVELFLQVSLKPENAHQKLKYEKKFNPNLDARNKFEFYESYLKKNKKLALRYTPDNWLNSKEKVFPLAGISNVETTLCNESGKWITFRSDRYGFNNPDNFWNNPYYLALGDSFTQGDCVKRSKNLTSNLSKLLKKNVLNLGYGGNGPLIELAALVEYSKVTAPKHIIWFFYEGNDVLDFYREKRDSLLIKYLNDENFSQNLVNKQPDIDNLIRKKSLNVRKNYNTLSKIITFTDFIKLRKIRSLFHKQNFLVDDSLLQIFIKGKKISKKLNSKFTVILIPSYERYREQNNNIFRQKKIYSLDDNIAKLENMFKKEKIEFINLHKNFFSKTNDPLNFYPFRYNNHFTENGYYEISNFIYNNLK